MRRRITTAAVGVVVAVMVASCAPRPDVDLAAHGARYAIAVEHNIEIELTDGRVLRADLYRPVEPATGEVAQGPFPVIVGLTPYGKSLGLDAEPVGAGGANLDLVRSGYIAAVVDVPGTGVSDGRFELFAPDEATAGAEVIEWAGDLRHSNGRVGMIGHSYSAIDQLFTAAAVGPDSPLKAIFPMSATVDPYRDLFVSGGALNVMSPLGLLFGYGITRSLTPFVEAGGDPAMALHYAGENAAQLSRFEGVMASHMVNNGPRRYFNDFWATREPASILDEIVDNGVAVYLLGGLYDVFQRGVPLLYSGLQNAAVGRDVHAPMLPGQQVSGRYQVTFGPWTHGTIGDGIDLTELQLRWFDRWLKGIDNGIDETSTPLHVIEPGGESYDTATYPLTEAHPRRFWLHSEGRLDAVPPTGDEEADRILYTGIGEPCSVSTVQFAAGLGAEECLRPMTKPESTEGAVAYTTPPLTRPLRLAGPIGLTLWAESTRPDAFFAITIEDVAPDGTSMDITGGDQLGSLRALDESRSWPGLDGGYIRPYLTLTGGSRADVPVGVATRYDIEIRPAFATIPAGHRLRLRVATADFPHIIPLADLAGLFGGVYDIHHDATLPSFVDIPVAPIPAAVPTVHLRSPRPSGAHG